MKRCVLALAFVFSLLVSASTQAQVSTSAFSPVAVSMEQFQGPVVVRWATLEECFAATSAPNYRPTTESKKKVDLKKEVVVGHSTGGCADIDLPKDEGGGRGWVRVGTDGDLVVDRDTGKILRIKPCDNVVHRFVPFPASKPAVLMAEAPRQESSAVPDAIKAGASTISGAMASVVSKLPLQQPLPQPFYVKIVKESQGPAWYNPKGTTGKWAWGSVIGGAVACAIWCPPMVEIKNRNCNGSNCR